MLTYQEIIDLEVPRKTYEFLISPNSYMSLTCKEIYEFYRRKGIDTYFYKTDRDTLDIVPATKQEILNSDNDPHYSDFVHYVTLYPLDLETFNVTHTSCIHLHTLDHLFKTMEYRSDPTLIEMYHDGWLKRLHLIKVNSPFNICYREDDSEYIQTPLDMLWEYY